MANASETVRVREVYRYYQPPEIAGHSRPLLHDAALTAFAQLGAIRANAQRAAVSLTVGGREWILAIVGKTRSMQDDGFGDDPDGNRWAKIGEKEMGLAPRVVELLDGLDREKNGQPLSHIIVSDLKADERFIGHPIHAIEPFIRSVIAFPLRTSLNIVIGTYIIMDDKPRDTVSPGDVEWLSNMAITVMEHLEAEKARQMHIRSERMIKAIGLFVEGKSTIRDWWISGGHQMMGTVVRSALKDGRTADYYANDLFGVQKPPEGFAMRGIQDMLETGVSNNKRLVPPAGSSHSATSLTDSTTAVKTPSETWESNTHVTPEHLRTPMTPLADMALNPDPLDLPNSDQAHGKRLQEALLTSDLRKAFARASNLIREALVLDGCVFFDASIGSFGGSAHTSDKPLSAFKLDGSSGGPSSSDDEQRASDTVASGNNALDASNSPVGTPHSGQESEKVCNVLSFSTRTQSSINSHEPSADLLLFPERILSRLIKKYPHGRVMTFDKEALLSSSDSDQVEPSDVSIASGKKNTVTSTPPEKKMSREAEYKAIETAFPGARSIMFFPLWDSTKERWFAGTFMWSTRVLSPQEDITYMAAFGNTIMAEVARLNSLAVLQMKTNFISSISHELRSPLHGILGSVELLQDTPMDSMQVDMIDTIHTCGKTLLDTIDHVLDFSDINKKFNKFKRQKRKLRKESRDRNSAKRSISPSEGIENLCAITEDVMDSVYTGNTTRKHYSQIQDAHESRRASSDSPVVHVIMDMPWRPNWNFEIDVSIWQKILTNIVDNALKYTISGFIRLRLDVKTDFTSRKDDSQSIVTLTLTDSGDGMSKEFLMHHLYTPFMQDNSLASGTGLGMSIVKQVIYNIGGTIGVNSEQGTGTEVHIELPLRASESRVPESLAMFTDIRKNMAGRKACLVAFDSSPNLGETPTGVLSAEDQATIHLKSSMHRLFSEWFEMEIITAVSLDSPPEATVYVVAESHLPGPGNATERILNFCEQQRVQSEETSIILVLCSSNSPPEESTISTPNGHQIIFLQQPYGPHKLGAALHKAFGREPAQPVIQLPIREETEDSNLPIHNFPALHSQARSAMTSNPQIASDWPSEDVQPSAPGLVQTAAGADESDGGLARQPENEVLLVDKHQIRKALLVEDNKINLKLLVVYMTKLKIDHATAVNGLEALHLYKNAEGQFDIILMDISMPIMDGLTSAREIRKLEHDNNYPPAAIIALTGAASMNARQEAFSAGIDLFLTKPVPLRYLQQLLNSLRERGREALMEEGL